MIPGTLMPGLALWGIRQIYGEIFSMGSMFGKPSAISHQLSAELRGPFLQADC
jgi:hypothetical protein